MIFLPKKIIKLTLSSLFSEERAAPVHASEWYWDVLKNVNILPDSDVKISKRINNRKIDVVGIYKLFKNTSIVKENLAGWSEDFGLMVRDKECPAIRRSNLRGITLTASLVVRFYNSPIACNFKTK